MAGRWWRLSVTYETCLDYACITEPIRASRFACRCFGVNMPEMQRMLDIERRREEEPNKFFPRKLNRVMLNEAEEGKG